MHCNNFDAARRGAAGTAPYRYRCCGLVLESAFALTALRSEYGSDPADIVIAHGEVAPGKESHAGYRRNQIYDQFRYEVADGTRATIELLADARLSNVADLVVSRVLTALLYQRGVLPLHASAVAMPDGLVAICGISGAGKSTLAAVLARRGHLLAADDMLIVGESGTPPGASGVKLTAASLAHIGREPNGLMLANRVEAKFHLPLDMPAPPPLPIVRLVQLRSGPAAVRPLSAIEAAAGWRNCIRMPDLMGQAPDQRALWQQWLDLIGRVENLAVSHGGRMDALAEIADRLEPSNRQEFHG